MVWFFERCVFFFFKIQYHTAFPDFVFCFVLFCFVLIVVLFIFPFQSAEGDELFFFFFFFSRHFSLFPFIRLLFSLNLFLVLSILFFCGEIRNGQTKATGPVIYVYSLLYDTAAMLCS